MKPDVCVIPWTDPEKQLPRLKIKGSMMKGPFDGHFSQLCATAACASMSAPMRRSMECHCQAVRSLQTSMRAPCSVPGPSCSVGHTAAGGPHRWKATPLDAVSLWSSSCCSRLSLGCHRRHSCAWMHGRRHAPCLLARMRRASDEDGRSQGPPYAYPCCAPSIVGM